MEILSGLRKPGHLFAKRPLQSSPEGRCKAALKAKGTRILAFDQAAFSFIAFFGAQTCGMKDAEDEEDARQFPPKKQS